ncbi:MAG: hypothetical protein K1X57_09770 [Gemmataceae bacterium]|nr:hypothetical protein [Gemmataceae bacterium]
MKAFGCALRYMQHAEGWKSMEMRFHGCSGCLKSKWFVEAVQRHWSIEAIHCAFDLTLRKDDSKIRERTLANNLSWLRRFAISLVKRRPVKDSLRGKLLRRGHKTSFLAQVLIANTV